MREISDSDVAPYVPWIHRFRLPNFEYRYLDNLARGIHHTFAIRLFEEMTGAYVGLVLFPLVIWAMRRARIHRDVTESEDFGGFTAEAVEQPRRLPTVLNPTSK
jgi:hypothetical protein